MNMRGLAICGREFADVESLRPRTPGGVRTVAIDGHEVHCALVLGEAPAFDPDEHKTSVLVEKHAFSCNYRDKAFIMQMALTGPTQRCFFIGSDFVGTVRQVGSAVTRLAVGDRVVPDGQYPHPPDPGLPTNHGSRELEILPAHKLVRVPQGVPDEAAAALTICGQTAYSMVRRLELSPGEHVLVTAARSNTSLFVLEALRRHEVKVYALTTSPELTARLEAMGVHEVIRADRNYESLLQHERLTDFFSSTGGFDCIVDPFCDLYLARLAPFMNFGARYVTCGFIRQYPRHGPDDGDPVAARDFLPIVVLRNLKIMGNCLGQTADLERVLADCAAGEFRVPIDAVYSGDEFDRFLHRTYSDPERFGKVVFRYD